MDFWENIWNVLWVFFWAFAFVAYLMCLFSVLADLFRDRELGGFWKAVWILFLIFLPFLTLLIYLIARGNGMAQRNIALARQQEAATQDYIRQVANVSPAEEIARAQALLDAGSISQPEFEALKARALAS